MLWCGRKDHDEMCVPVQAAVVRWLVLSFQADASIVLMTGIVYFQPGHGERLKSAQIKLASRKVFFLFRRCGVSLQNEKNVYL